MFYDPIYVFVRPCLYSKGLRQSVAGLSPRRSELGLSSVHASFVVDKVALGQFFMTSGSSCQYHSTKAPYSFVHIFLC